MEKVEEFTKSIEEMGLDTLRRYVLSLQERMQLREAHADAVRKEQEELIARTMRKVIQEESRRKEEVERRADFGKFIETAISDILGHWREYLKRRNGNL